MVDSAEVNFGTKALTGVAIWPVDKSVPESMWPAAVDIFAFDALIQNPDRGFNNPNLFTKGDSFLVFDHETAFSFLFDILPSPTPWKLGGQPYLTDHVFYRKARSDGGRARVRAAQLGFFFKQQMLNVPHTVKNTRITSIPLGAGM